MINDYSVLHKCVQRVAGYISEPMELREIVEKIDSDDYNAELMLQHLLMWVDNNIANETASCEVSCFGHKATIVLGDKPKDLLKNLV